MCFIWRIKWNPQYTINTPITSTIYILSSAKVEYYQLWSIWVWFVILLPWLKFPQRPPISLCKDRMHHQIKDLKYFVWRMNHQRIEIMCSERVSISCHICVTPKHPINLSEQRTSQYVKYARSPLLYNWCVSSDELNGTLNKTSIHPELWHLQKWNTINYGWFGFGLVNFCHGTSFHNTPITSTIYIYYHLQNSSNNI